MSLALPTPAPAEAVSALVAAARRGDGAALDRLFRRFAPMVHGVLLGQMQKADADDLTQEVFETVLGQLQHLREDAAFPGWLLTIARRAAVSARRRPRHVGAGEIDVGSHADAPDQHTEAQRVLDAIRSLPEAYREPLVLRLVQGLSGQEIADLTGLTAGSVRVNLHRGMTRLREALAIRSTDP